MKKNLLVLLGILVFSIFALHTVISYNFEYVNVTVQVNITNAYPEIISILPDSDILLGAGTNKTVYCNVSIRDWNGYDDIANVNATFFDNNTVTSTSPDNNNSHYTNTNCTLVANDTQYIANYSCSFGVWYYALNGSNWVCNVSVIDAFNFTDEGYNTTTIQAYYAINVTSPIDFGDMYVGEEKNNITANVTNFGNRPINVSVDGYGVTNGDGLAMNCAQRNISVGSLHYSLNASQTYAQKTNLTDTAANITGLTVPKRTTGMLWNTTYWDLWINPVENPFGVCNGTVVFTAQSDD